VAYVDWPVPRSNNKPQLQDKLAKTIKDHDGKTHLQ
jgi:hypothetical protein